MAFRITRRLASGYRAQAGTKGYDGKMVVGQPNIYARRPRGSGAGLGNSINIIGGPGKLAATAQSTFVAPGQPMYSEWDGRSAVEKGYLGHAYVMRCVRLRAETVAGLPFRAGPDPMDPSTVNASSPLVHLLGEATPQAPGGPNPQTTARAFWIWSIVQRIVTGKMAWELDRASANAPVEGLWPLVSALLQPVPDVPGQHDWFASFVYNTPFGDKPLPTWKVLYDWRMSAKDPRQPESVLQAAMMPVQIAIAADKYMWGLISQGMTAAKLVVAPDFEEAGARRAWEDQFNAAFTGYDNAGKTIFSYWDPEDEDPSTGKSPPPEVQVEDLSMTSVDAQFQEMVSQSKIDIEVALGVPESILGNASQRVFSNASEETRNFWSTTVIDDISELQDAVNLRLAPQVSPGENGWFDLSRVAVLQPPTIFQQPALADAINLGIVSASQAADLLGIPAVNATGEDVDTAPIDEEPVMPGTPTGGAGSRAVVFMATRRMRTRAHFEQGAAGLRTLEELVLPDGWGYKYRSVNLATYRNGTAGWGIVRVPRPRVALQSGTRSDKPFSHAAPTPSLASEVTARAAQLRRHRLMRAELGVRSRSALVAAGIAVKAADTGRVLMVQRVRPGQVQPPCSNADCSLGHAHKGPCDVDAAAGKLEFPGGHIEPGEDSFDAAAREWSEEVGQRLPEGNHAGMWTSPNGVYRGHVVVVPHEADVPINGRPKVKNPDNPGRKYTETAVWMDPEHIEANPAVRDEVVGTAGTWLPVVKAAGPLEGNRSGLDPFSDFDAWFEQAGPGLAALVESQ